MMLLENLQSRLAGNVSIFRDQEKRGYNSFLSQLLCFISNIKYREYGYVLTIVFIYEKLVLSIACMVLESKIETYEYASTSYTIY
jgi:hypothetical protein